MIIKQFQNTYSRLALSEQHYHDKENMNDKNNFKGELIAKEKKRPIDKNGNRRTVPPEVRKRNNIFNDINKMLQPALNDFFSLEKIGIVEIKQRVFNG